MSPLRSSSPSPFQRPDPSLSTTTSSNLSSSSIVLSSSGIHEKALSGSVPSCVLSRGAGFPSGAGGGGSAVPKYERICIPMSTEDLFYQSGGGVGGGGGGSQAAALTLALAYPVGVFRYLKEKFSAGAVASPASASASAAAAAFVVPSGETTGGRVCSASKGVEAGGGTCHRDDGESKEVLFERALWALGSLADSVYVGGGVGGGGMGEDDDRDVREVLGSILDKLGDIDGGEAEDPGSDGAVVEDFVVVNLRARYIEMVAGVVTAVTAAEEAGGGDYQDQAVLHCGSGF